MSENDSSKLTLAIMEGKELSPDIPDNLSSVSCYVKGCKNKPYYTIGALLPSGWFTQQQKSRLVPVIVTSCIEHRNKLIDNLPPKTVSVVIRDVSKQSYSLISDMLKQAIIRKEDEITIYFSS